MNKLLFLIFLFTGTSLFAQENRFQSATDSDPEAVKVLNSLKKQYDQYTSVEADFVLTIEMPEEDPVIQKGNVKRQGDQYHISMPSQQIISDGKNLWFHQIDNKSVQWQTVDPDDTSDELLSPQNFMQFYENGKFVAAPVTVANEDGQPVRWIELKPVDEDSEYFKFRVSIALKKDAIRQVKAFGKDGSRYTFAINALTPNKDFKASIFTFNAADFPGVTVEDLRVD